MAVFIPRKPDNPEKKPPVQPAEKTEAAPAAQPEPPKEKTAAEPASSAALTQESGDHFEQLEQMVNRKKPEPRKQSADKSAKPAVVVTSPRRRVGLFEQVLNLFKKRK